MKLRIEADAIHTISAAGEPQAVLLRCLYAAHLCFHSNIIRLICNHYMPVSHKISSLHRAATAPMNKCIKKHTRGFMTDDYSYMTTFFQGHYKKTKTLSCDWLPWETRPVHLVDIGHKPPPLARRIQEICHLEFFSP